MRVRLNWLANSARRAGAPPCRASWPQLLSLLTIGVCLATPLGEALARQDKPAVTQKTKATVHRKQAAKVRHKAKKSDTEMLRVARVDRQDRAAAGVGPYLEAREPEPGRRPQATARPGEPDVASRTVLVYDETQHQPIFGRNDAHAQPIASITKLMTAMVVLDAKQPMDERLTITWDDVDHLRGSSSRVPVGAALSREELLRLALMSSENRAAAALSRNYPGGSSAFVRAMNAKAAELGMSRSHFEDSTGLHGGNRASAMDLVRMVQAAHQYEPIREFSTTGSHSADLGRKHVEFRNTNALVRSPDWDIGLSKTGYIREAGRCLVMHARIAARPVVIVLLDGDGKYTRLGDAARIKKWLEARWRGDALAGNS